MNRVIEIKNLDFTYDKESKNYIFENLNLEIYKNEFVALVGENGVGKSTLLKLILNNLKATSGGIKIFENDVEEKKHYQEISYISQNSVANYRHLPTTVEEVIKQHLKFLKKKQNVEDYLRIVDLEKKAKKSLGQLSGGELQRVAILLALIKEAKLIILDEPTSNIDKKFSKELFALLKNLAREDKTILIVTHDIEEIVNYVDYILQIKNCQCQRLEKIKFKESLGRC
ncbi:MULTISPECIES: metal ABC transporter ATP-binding protein [unclassified Gemella]|uniref:metal ABC transporter ATP-binding protein n=1 Tax=unclassified Gemella TaxID=2624949 RepID=UPI001C05617A|nr:MULTISPECIES: ATP-binding cassette domain-containing protein [unclassified Gemella]MBU0279004.1 ATP-binding cassette domain-containing protein [Gemella sp. zg-1178]QWQ38732.1 ATP-binding cassette domain-containing protein [Gemella sp. zg-570]